MTSLHAKDPRRYQVRRLCELFGVSKQAYYKRDESALLQKVAKEAFVVEYVRKIREKDPGIGGKKLWLMYSRDFSGNDPVGRDSFADIIDRHNLKVRMKMRRPRTTDSTHGLPTFPNIVKDYIPTAVNCLWVSDITDVPIWKSQHEYRFAYLALILDAYSEEIVGWSVGPSLATDLPLEALRMALKRIEGKEAASLIHHSDRGCQYASSEYIKVLKDNNIRISMTESGDPKDNAKAERINNTIKNEFLKGMRFTSVEQVKTAISSAVDFYNNERPHMSVDMMTPNEAAACVGELRKHWTSYREIAIKRSSGDEEIPGKGLPLRIVPGLTSGGQPRNGISLGLATK